MKIAKRGDTIQWDLPKECHDTLGKTHQAEVAMVDRKEKHYGVYAKYGQDLIPFEQAIVIKESPMNTDQKLRIVVLSESVLGLIYDFKKKNPELSPREINIAVLEVLAGINHDEPRWK